VSEVQAAFPNWGDEPCKSKTHTGLNANLWLIQIWQTNDGRPSLFLGTFPFEVSAGDWLQMDIDMVCH
jgi:hypothetical protein